MPVVQGPTVVTGNSASAWVATDGQTNIIVGVKGANYRVQYHLGDESSVYASDESMASNGGVLIAKAAAVRVVAKKANDVSFEVFA